MTTKNAISHTDAIAHDIMHAASLDSLASAIERYNALGRDDKADADNAIRWDALPTFGEKHIPEADREGVFSWDRTRLLILDGQFTEIRLREFDHKAPCPIEVMVGTGDDINPHVKAVLRDGLSSPDYNDPAIMTRVAALAQALGLKMQGDDAKLFYMSEEEQVLVDDSDGLLILTSGDSVAWEAFDVAWDDAGDAD